jgi:ubiquinone biosynthesis protein
VVTLIGLQLRGRLDAGEVGIRVRALAEHFGGLWVKIAQLVSLRIDLFGAEFCRELARLQESGSGLPGKVTVAIIERELRSPLDAVFEWFDRVPMAAASIGQVHRARLRGGAEVAVKVQRPGIADRIERQLARIDRAARVADRLGILPQLSWRQFAWELREVLREELDYRYEAANTERMRRSLRRHGIRVPSVYREASTARMLTTGLIEGAPMVEFIAVMATNPAGARAWLGANHIDPRRVARRLSLSLLRQILEENLFHGDLHPGNIILLPNSDVALLDFGTVSSTDRDYLEKFRAMTRALVTGDFSTVADLILLMCSALPAMDTRPIADDLMRVVEAWTTRTHLRDLPFHEKSLNNLYGEVTRVLVRHRCTFEWAFLRIRRAQETLDASMLVLYPEVNPTELAHDYFVEASRRARRAAVLASRQQLAAAAAAAERTSIDAAEAALFEVELIRRRALTFEARAGRIAVLGAAVTSLVAATGVVVSVILVTSVFGAEWLAGSRLSGAGLQVHALLLALSVALTQSTWRLSNRLRHAPAHAADRFE